MVILCEMSPLPLGWWRHSTRTGGFTLRWKACWLGMGLYLALAVQTDQASLLVGGAKTT